MTFDELFPGVEPERVKTMLEQRHTLMKYLSYCVEKMGGEVRITPQELLVDRVFQRDVIGLTGVVRLTVEKP